MLASPPALGILQNPGFELPPITDDNAADDKAATDKAAGDGPAGAGLPGWTLAEHEGSTQAIDASEKKEGQHSLKLKTAAATATLRSNSFATPGTGRLSVSVWLRVADRSKQPTLRLALEGRQEDGLYYRFATVGGNAAGAVPLATAWSQYIFQVDDLPAGGDIQDLRVRFDLTSPGEIWIDQVELFDLAFSPNERVELTKIIGLADLKLKSGQLADCARLLDGYWPHFLVTNVPLTETSASVAQQPPARPPRPERIETAKKPGMLDQMRGYFPKWWQ